VRAFADNAPPGDFIGKWISMIAPAAAMIEPMEEPSGTYLMRLELASLRHSLANLATFPCVRQQAERGRLALHGAYFDVASGELVAIDPTSGEFVSVVAD
jgi:carbonic anhydrase